MASMSALFDDVRLAARALRRSPRSTIVALGVLALGIGATITAFRWMETSVLDPLPGVVRPAELAVLLGRTAQGEEVDFSHPDFLDLKRDAPPGITDITAHKLEAMTIRIASQPEQVWGEIVSGNYFEVLGVGAAVGRTFGPEDDQVPGRYPVVVLSHAFWLNHFGGDPSVVGREVAINGHAFTVVGVARANFRGAMPGMSLDLWIPTMMQGAVTRGDRISESSRGTSWLLLMARLAPGTQVSQVTDLLNRVGDRLASAQVRPDFPIIEAYALRESPRGVTGVLGTPAIALFGSAGVLLLIVCANLAGLQSLRLIDRRREMATRRALGASRLRLIRQVLAEGAVLGFAGAALGLGAARWMSEGLWALMPFMPVPLVANHGLTLRSLGLATALAFVTLILLGLAAAAQASRAPLSSVLQSTVRTGNIRHRSLRLFLVGGQIALSMVIVVSALLCAQAFDAERGRDPGFTAERVLLGSIDLERAGYDEANGTAFYEALLEQIEALPGVESAALANELPVCLCGGSRQTPQLEGHVAEAGELPRIRFNRVTPGYFETLGVDILEGRPLNPSDGPEGAPAVVVNETMATRYWNGVAVGRQVRVGGRDFEVVGVARTTAYRALGEAPEAFMYFSIYQYFDSDVVVHVRTSGEPASIAGALRREVARLDPDLAVFDLRTLEEHLGVGLFAPRAATLFLTAVSLMAMALAGVGLYGSIAHSVGQRTREIGIRMALGAEAASVQRAVVGEGLVIGFIGVAGGFTMAWLVAPILEAWLTLPARQPLTYAGAAALLMLVALTASWAPARRAARLDPLNAIQRD